MQKNLSVKLGGIEIFSNGQFLLDPVTESKLSDYLLDGQLYSSDIKEIFRTYPSHYKTIDIDVVLDTGIKDEYVFYGSDLTAEYVEINADYRS